MASQRPALLSKSLYLASLVAAVAGGWAGEALAAPDSLREGLFGRSHQNGQRLDAPPVARYVSEDGLAFVLDRSTARPLLKFEGSSEVWALQAQPAPRGDVIYKNDLGEPVLRATRLGGLTLFTDARPGGSAVALTGSSSPLRLPTLGPQALLERLAEASAKASRAARRLIPFEADASPASAPLIADAAMVAAEAMARMASRPNGGAALATVSKVRLVEGRRAGVDIDRGVLEITVAPGQGLAGRPSSERILVAAGSR